MIHKNIPIIVRNLVTNPFTPEEILAKEEASKKSMALFIQKLDAYKKAYGIQIEEYLTLFDELGRRMCGDED